MKTLSQRMHAAGACFVPDGDGLRIRAPGPLPPDLLVDLRAARGDLLDVYRERAAIMELDGGLSRVDAERKAARDVLASLDGIGSFRGANEKTPKTGG